MSHCLRLHGTLPSITLHVWPALLTQAFSLVRFVIPAVSEALRPFTFTEADQRTKTTGGVGGDGWRRVATGGVGDAANGRRDPIDCEPTRAVNDRGSTDFGSMAATAVNVNGSMAGAAPLAAATLQLHLPSVELHVHEQLPQPGDPADLLVAKLTGLSICCDAEPVAGVDAEVYLGNLSVLDARRCVPEALALILSLRAEAAMCPPPQLSASIVPVDLRPAGATRERARAAGSASVGRASQTPSASTRLFALWKLPRHLIAIPGATASVDAPPKPLLRVAVRPPDVHGILAVHLVAVCQVLGVQWNPGLIAS